MFRIFKTKKPKTALDSFNTSVVEMFRPHLSNNKNVSDETILELVQTVMRAFKQAAESKGEEIPATALVNITSKFIKVFDISGHDFFIEHLKYEINLYLTSGLRDDYL